MKQKKVTAEEVLSAVSAGRSVKQAAALLNVSERTIYNVMAGDEYAEARREMQGAILNACIVNISDKMLSALNVISGIMEDAETPPGTRLTAAAAVLKNGLALLDAAKTNADRETESGFGLFGKW